MKKIIGLLVFSLIAVILIGMKLPQESVSQITSPLSSSVLGTQSSKDNQILFVSNRSGNRDIYQMDLLTKKITQLTTDSSDEMNPRVAPDGSTIVFYSNYDGDNEIYEMDLNTGQTRKMTDNSANDYDPSYSFDGNQIIFKSDRDDLKGDIFLMNHDGSALQNITLTRSETEEWDPVISPDGSIFFVVRKGTDHTTDELYLMPRVGEEAKPITDNRVADWYPDITGSGRELVYISKAKATLDDDLFLMNLLTKESTRLTYQEGNDADPSFDRLGKRIIFINDKDGDYDLYLMNIDGSGIEKILNTSDEELSPVFL